MVDAEKIKKGLNTCALRSAGDCTSCPYFENTYCNDLLASDAAEYIASLEERIAIMQESMETLGKRCNALDALEQRCKTLEKDHDRIKVTRCKDCRYFEPSNAEEGDNSGYCRNDYAPCQNQTVDAWWFCGSAERVSE